jgi:hypothetical protein
MEMYVLLQSQRGDLLVWNRLPGDCVVTVFPVMTIHQGSLEQTMVQSNE